MLKTVSCIALVLAIALGAGVGSVWLALETTHAIGSTKIGAWTAFPKAGTRQADPYSHARSARAGDLALGQAEGVTFIADQDEAGAQLERQCSYRIEGRLPPVRFFTLHAVTPDRRLVPAPGKFLAARHSQSLLWAEGETLEIAISPHPHPGNWLALSGSGPMRLVLTLFDTPVFIGARIDELTLPRILKTGCADGG